MQEKYQLGDHEVTLNIPEGFMVTNVVIATQIQSIDGKEGVIVAWPEETSGVTANGLLFSAYHRHANMQGVHHNA